VCTNDHAALTFDAQGTASSSDSQSARITSGTFQVTSSSDGQTLYSGNINGGNFNNNTLGGSLFIASQVHRVPDKPPGCAEINDTLAITTSCSTSDINNFGITGSSVDNFGSFYVAVECSQGGVGDTTQSSSSSSMTGTRQDRDSDGDGILDANDNCPNLSHTRCYKEGDTALVVHNSNS
jgi:hypothetical protein